MFTYDRAVHSYRELSVPLRSFVLTAFYKARDTVLPPAAEVLEVRAQRLLRDYEKLIAQKNKTAENHERLIAQLNENITVIDHEITEIEVFADVLKRLLNPS